MSILGMGFLPLWFSHPSHSAKNARRKIVTARARSHRDAALLVAAALAAAGSLLRWLFVPMVRFMTDTHMDLCGLRPRF